MTAFLNTLRLTAEQRQVLQAALQPVWPLLKRKHCFDNCVRIMNADASGRLAYVEGLLHSPKPGDQPHKHAWLLLDEIIIDPTFYLAGYVGLLGYEAQRVTRRRK
jgi:hypothetical protein